MKLFTSCLAFIAGVTISGCSQEKPFVPDYIGNNQNPNPTYRENADDSERVNWTIEIRNNCINMPLEKCNGGYGFSINSDGNFSVGPGPQNQVLRGQATPSEAKKLRNILSAVTEDNEEQPRTCIDNEEIGDTKTEIIISSLENPPMTLVETKEKTFCYFNTSETKAKSLYRIISELSKKYYVLPFPNACINAILALDKMHETVRHCVADSDCAYIDDLFSPIVSRFDTSLIFDDCSPVKRLPTANAFEVLGKQAELITAREIARDYCEEYPRKNCEGPLSVSTALTKPECRAGLCEIASSIRINRTH